MDALVIRGGNALRGKVRVGGAKNASLPILAASLLAAGECKVEEVPSFKDIDTMCGVLSALGAVTCRRNNTVLVDSTNIHSLEPPYDLVRSMRASFLVMGPLLARTSRAKISLPGGCAIGSRPIDLHLKGFSALGARVDVGFGYVEADVPDRLRGSRVYLDFPSVGATENIMMAAVMAQGTTVVENAAQEPEIVDVANFLNAMGAKVRGAGTNVLRIEGVDCLCPTTHMVIPDRIEAGTLMAAAAITCGDLLIDNVVHEHLKAMTAKLREAGAAVEVGESWIRVSQDSRPRAVDVKTMPYPGFPTDLQAQLMAVMCIAEGTSLITETVFENRFMHASELSRMGANIKIDGRTAVVEGQSMLLGASVNCTDLRAGAALVLAGLAANGTTEVQSICHLDRGYERIERKLSSVGADVERVSLQASAAIG